LSFATFYVLLKTVRVDTVAALSFPIKHRVKKTYMVSAFRRKNYQYSMFFRSRFPFRGQQRLNKSTPTFKRYPSLFNEFFFFKRSIMILGASTRVFLNEVCSIYFIRKEIKLSTYIFYYFYFRILLLTPY